MFGHVVVTYRQRDCLTQEELADRTGLSVRAIRDLESGRVRTPRQSSVRRLADAFRLEGPQREQFLRSAADPSAAAEPGTATAGIVTMGAAAPVAPAQLPLDLHCFTGRSGALDRLGRLFSADGAATAVVVVAGTAGVGKTTLAVHWAHCMAERFPDGQLYLNLRGFDPRGSVMDPAEAVHAFLDAFGVPAQRLPTTLDAQVALYRSHLVRRRLLIVLDNARDAEQVRDLLPGTPGCLVLVTSRRRLTGLVATHGAHHLTLDLLTAAESRELIAARLGLERVAEDPAAVDDIVAASAGLPLALVILAARAAVQSDLPLSQFAVQLRDHDRLHSLDGGEPATDLRSVLSWSYRQLSPSGARLFRYHGLQPGGETSVAVAASLVGEPVSAVRPFLAELTHAHLLSEPSPGRYTFHDLLRAYATELTHRHDSETDRHDAVRRILDHYLHTAHAAAMLLDPHRDLAPLPARADGVTTQRLVTREQAIDWFETERAALRSGIGRAATLGLDQHAVQLACALKDVLERRGHWEDWLSTQQAALAAAERLADQSEQARCHRSIARVYTLTGRPAEAGGHLRRALEIHRLAGDTIGQAYVLGGLCTLAEQQARHREAIGFANKALGLYRASGHPIGEGLALNSLGWNHTLLGEHRLAVSYCEQALRLQRETNDRYAEANTLDSLGHAQRSQGNHREAVDCFRQAATMFQDLGDIPNRVSALTGLGDAQLDLGTRDAAHRTWQEAMDLLATANYPDVVDARQRLRERLAPQTDRGTRQAAHHVCSVSRTPST